MPAHQRSEMPNNPRPVFVVHQEEDTFGNDLDGPAVQPHDSRLIPLSNNGAAGRKTLPARNDRDMHPFVVIRLLVGLDLFDDQAKAARQRPHVYLVDLLASDRFEEAGEHGASDWVGWKFGGFAAVSDDDLIVPLRRNLSEQFSEPFTQ